MKSVKREGVLFGEKEEGECWKGMRIVRKEGEKVGRRGNCKVE